MIAKPHTATTPHTTARFAGTSLSAVAAVLLATAWPAPATSAQQPQPAAAQVSAKPAPKGMAQSIQIAGYWRIDVRNPNGSLARHVEFENSLTDNAIQRGLPYALFGAAGLTGIDAPFIGVDSGASVAASNAALFPFEGNLETSPCGNEGCLITQPGSAAYYQCQYFAVVRPVEGYTGPTCFNTGSISYVGGFPVLSGSFVATQSGYIDDVWSYITFCQTKYPNAANPVACPLPSGTPAPSSSTSPPAATTAIDLTSYTLPSQLAVASGQSVNISVTLTFSSPAAPASNGNARPGPSVAPTVLRPPTSPGKP